MTRNKQEARKQARQESNRQFKEVNQRRTTITIINPRQPLVATPVNKPTGLTNLVFDGAVGIIIGIGLAVFVGVKAIAWIGEKFHF